MLSEQVVSLFVVSEEEDVSCSRPGLSRMRFQPYLSSLQTCLQSLWKSHTPRSITVVLPLFGWLVVVGWVVFNKKCDSKFQGKLREI